MTSGGTTEPLVPGPISEAYLANESLYVWWYDRDQGIVGIQRIAQQPNNEGRGRAQVWSAIVTEDGRRFRRGGEVEFDPAWRAGPAFVAEGLSFELEEGRSRVSYRDRDCELEIVFTDVHEPVDWAHAGQESGPDLEDVWFAGHIEVGGSVEGRLKLAGEETEVRGLAYRDHSWGGQRDMRPIRSSRWANGTTGPDCTYGVTWAALSDGNVVEGGYVCRDGKVSVVTSIDLVVGLDVDSVSWRRARMDLGCADGSTLNVEYGPTFDGVVFQSGDWITCDSPTRILADGKEGAGTIEVGAAARGGLEFPRTIVRAAYEDGFSRREQR